MDGGSECLCIHSMMYLATGFAAESRDAGLVRAGPFRGSIAVRNWSKAAAVSRAVQAILMAASSACLVYSLCCRAENSEIARCKGKGSTVVDAVRGAGQRRVSRTLGDGVRIAYHHLHAYDNSINLICTCRQQRSRIWYPHNPSPT
jgi:hypothetical protein